MFLFLSLSLSLSPSSLFLKSILNFFFKKEEEEAQVPILTESVTWQSVVSYHRLVGRTNLPQRAELTTLWPDTMTAIPDTVMFCNAQPTMHQWTTNSAQLVTQQTLENDY